MWKFHSCWRLRCCSQFWLFAFAAANAIDCSAESPPPPPPGVCWTVSSMEYPAKVKKVKKVKKGKVGLLGNITNLERAKRIAAGEIVSLNPVVQNQMKQWALVEVGKLRVQVPKKAVTAPRDWRKP